MPRFYKVKKKLPRTSKRSTTSAIVIKAKKSVLTRVYSSKL